MECPYWPTCARFKPPGWLGTVQFVDAISIGTPRGLQVLPWGVPIQSEWSYGPPKADRRDRYPYFPVPLNETVNGVLMDELFTVRLPVRAPFAVGVNVTLSVQVPPLADTLPPHVSDSAKSPAVTVLKVRGVLRLFLSTVCLAALVVPTVSVPKTNDVLLIVACARPVP